MTDLEERLHALATEVEWPATPPLRLRLEPRRARRPLLLALAAAVVVALAVALAVPAARSAILRFFHLRGVTVERVPTLPSAPERTLGRGLGAPIDTGAARRALRGSLFLPAGATPPLHLRAGVVSALLPGPVLLSEFRAQDAFLIKRVAATGTTVQWIAARGEPAIWIAGARHVVALPHVPPRLAGNVLVWEQGTLALRLEGPSLTRAAALRLARNLIPSGGVGQP